MGGPQIDAGVDVQSPAKNNKDSQSSGSNFNASVAKASGAAESFLSEVKGIETDLMDENRRLLVQLTARDLTISGLQAQVKSLQSELANQPDCDEVSAADERRTDDDLTNPSQSKSRRAGSNRQAISD